MNFFILLFLIVMGKEVKLPAPKYDSKVSLEKVIFNRRSIRKYQDKPLSLEEVGQLLWSAGGKTIDGVTGATRAYPSAGGLYPLEIYLVAGNVKDLSPGIYHYNWKNHTISLIKEGDYRSQLCDAALGQDMILTAPISIVYFAIYSRTTGWYGKRGVQYVHIDLGHSAQNVSLQAEAMELGSVPIGAFHDEEVKSIFKVDGTPIYIIPIGKK